MLAFPITMFLSIVIVFWIMTKCLMRIAKMRHEENMRMIEKGIKPEVGKIDFKIYRRPFVIRPRKIFIRPRKVVVN